MRSKFQRKFSENIFRFVVFLAAISSILFLFGIIFVLFRDGIKTFHFVSVFKFLFGTQWYPTQSPPEFGIAPLILGSLEITILTLIFAIPLGVGAAIYISEIASPKEKEFLKPIIELLAGIPSVVYGLFGMVYLSPIIMKLFKLDTGLTAFTASIVLSIMVIPIITSLSEDAINSVPKSLREASLALGANKWETIVRVVVPSAKSGILTSIILGFGRAIGETMVVVMVAGNAAIIPKSIFQPVRAMPASIAAELGETVQGGAHYYSLFGIGLVLFVITFILILISEFVRNKKEKI